MVFGSLSREESRVINKGISGNRTGDLVARWQKDCLDIQPDIVSILIGINDTWRRYDSNDPSSAEVFEVNYRRILTETAEKTKAKIMLLEPFVLPALPDRAEWRVDLDPEIHIVRKLSREFNTLLVPLDGLLAQASGLREPSFWASDGVHPTAAGHALISQAWLKAVKAL
jgi:lysophospholipase L1-like esterase